MRVVALVSGGKDSCYNMLQCVSEGHHIVALANLRPQNKDELDSYMFQTVGHHAIDVYAEAMGLPLFRRTIQGFSKVTSRDYKPTVDDEVEDLYELLKVVMDEIEVDAVSVGAILSDYQRVRVENVCQRLNLTSLSYLWRRDQETLLKEMIDCHVEAIIIKVAALGLEIDKHLCNTLEQIYPHMKKMCKMYGLNVCGEGGEYETFTLDCPLFVKKIVIDKTETVIHSDDAFAQVGYLNIHNLHLEDKPVVTNTPEYIKTLPLARSSDLLSELMTEEEIKDHSDMTINPYLPHNTNTQGTVAVTSRKLGDWFYISGLQARLEPSQTIEKVTLSVMERMKKAVEELQCQMEDIVSVCLYVHSMKDFNEVNSVYKNFFGINPPVRVCVQVCTPPNVALMLDCCGCVTDQQEATMHVQSISHWAPANIGPYSQACKRGDKICVAGQIAMVPATLQIIEGGMTAQCQLSLRHTGRVLAAIHTGCTLNRVLLTVCYVTHSSFVLIAQKEWQKAVLHCRTVSSEIETWIPLLQVVVVPALPKGAVVEWQVSAYAGDQKLQELCHEETSENSAVSLRCCCSTEDKNVFACVATLECLMPIENLDSYKKCLAFLFECLVKLLTQASLRLCDIPFLRIFYTANHFTHSLHTAILDSITAIVGSDDAPLFSLIPVIQTGCNENTLLSMCC